MAAPTTQAQQRVTPGSDLRAAAASEPPRAAPVLRTDPARRIAKPAPKPPHHARYAAAWALSGLLAGAYVFTLVLRQDGGGLLARSDRESVETMARTQADVSQLQQKVGRLETDMARVKIDQAEADDREKQIVQRIGTIENRVETFSAQIAQAAPPAKIAKSAPEKAPAARIATGALPTVASPVVSKQPPTAARNENPAPQPVAATPAPAVDAAAGVLLARGPSLDALRLSWSLLNERYKGTLKSMEPRVVEVEPGTYQLVAGPVANPAEALKVCAALRARGVACQPADFKGNAF